MDTGLLAGFLLVSVTLACTPGADWAYIISSAVRLPKYAQAVWGLLAGYLFHTALLVCGIAAVVAKSPALLDWLTAAGCLYLLWLGVSTIGQWRSAHFHSSYQPNAAPLQLQEEAAAETESGAGSLRLQTRTKPKSHPDARRGPFIKGFLTSASNPKALLLYVALIPQFISPTAAAPLPLQTAALGLAHFFVSIAVYFTVAKATEVLLRSRPMAARIITLCSGIIMVLLAAGLIFERFIA